MSCLSSLTYKPDSQVETTSSTGMRKIRRVNTKSIEEEAHNHTGPLGVACVVGVTSSRLSLWVLRETSYGTLSAALIYFKDTWKSTRTTLWSSLTTGLFDVTLPHLLYRWHRHTSQRRSHCQGWSLPFFFQLRLQTNVKQQQNPTNKSWFANTTLICLRPRPCWLLM